MNKTCTVFSGYFAPFHNGHLAALLEALITADRLIVLIAGAQTARSAVTPWTADEREAMVRAGLGDGAERVVFRHVRDHVYRPDLWDTEARARVAEVTGEGFDVTLETPDMLAQSARLREAYFMTDKAALQAQIPSDVVTLLHSLATSVPFAALKEEYDYIADYKRQWSVAPYPPTLVVVDTVIVHSGHLLLVQRGAIPGKDLWALPGGFVEADETLLHAALRELREETSITLSDDILLARLKARQVFDAPERSARGRAISHGFHFVFEGGDLPDVQGGDDAEHAVWTPLSQLAALRGQFFEDHFSMLEAFDILPGSAS